MAFTAKLGTSDSNLVGATMIAGGGLVDPLKPKLSHTLSMSSHTGAQGSASNVILWSQTASFDISIGDFEAVGHSLGIGHTVEFSGTINILEQNLGIGHTVDVVNFGPLVHTLYMEHAVTYAGPVAVDVANTISMSGFAGRAREESVSHNLNLISEGKSVEKSELNLEHSVFGYLNASPFFEQEMDITHEVQVTAAYAANLEHTDVVSQAVTFWVDDGTSCPRNDYQEWGTLPAEPLTGIGGQMTLVAIDGSDDIVLLRNPELDDRDRLSQARINRESRGGELQIYRDPTWPLVNTLQATVVGLKKEDVDELLSFFEDHLGEEISLNDWHGRYWRGVVINPEEPVVEDTRNRWTVAFQFEGVEQPGPDIFDNVGIAHTVNVVQELTRDLTSNLGMSHTVDVSTDDVIHNGDNVQYNNVGINEVTYSG